MKKRLLSLLLFVFLVSCEKEYAHTYIIKNTSQHDIQITGFDKIGAYFVANDSSELYSETFKISPNSEFKKVKQAGYHADEQGVFDSSELDSIQIIFDSESIITFACNQPVGINCSGSYNIMNYEDNYEKVLTGRSSGEEEYTYTFVLAESDYEYAKPLK